MFNLSKTVQDIEKEKIEKRKSIPSKVFFNHFYAINQHIKRDNTRFDLKKVNYYNSIKLLNKNCSIDTIRKLLWNSWSTEYAFNIGSMIGNEEYYKFAMHWNFPQAYYSIYLAMTAFHETQGIANNQHEKSIKLFSNSIKDNHYPEAISFYSEGLHNEFQFSGLNQFKQFPESFSGLSSLVKIEEIQTQIALFLKTTRESNAKHKRKIIEKTPINRINKLFLTKKGSITQNFQKKHWDNIYMTIPFTSLLNCLYRLRIKANYHDIDSFLNADIDFQSFNESLGGIIDYANFVHEAYIAKAIGKNKYKDILNDFPQHLGKETALKRYNNYILEILPQ